MWFSGDVKRNENLENKNIKKEKCEANVEWRTYFFFAVLLQFL